MPTAFNVRALATTVRITLDDTLSSPEQESIRAQWTDLSVDPDSAPAQTLRAGVGILKDQTRKGDVTPVVASSADGLADKITSAVTLAAIGGLTGEALILHAAAISLDDGRVVGFIGPSGRGKTTAARALSEAFGYVTDETLAVRPDGTVLAYPKPLSVGDRPAYKRHVAASSLGLALAPADGLHLAALVILDRQPGIEVPRVESLSLTDALPELVPQTSYFSQIDRPLLTLAELVRSTGGVRRVVYSEAVTLRALVDEIIATTYEDDAMMLDVASDSMRDCDCSKGSRPEVDDGATSEMAPPGTYRRTKHADALLLDEQLLVLRTHEVTVLDGVGPAVWLAANDSSEEELREAALSQLPEPPMGVDVTSVVAEAIQQLVEARLLVHR